MKKLLVLLVVSMLLVLAGCGNRDLFDTNYTYTKAIVEFPGGEVRELEIKQWKDYDGEQIQIIAKDGNTYLVSSFNTILVRED